MTKGDIAYQNFLSGMNCAQSVLTAFLDETSLDGEAALKIALPFGGGMGRMRLTCGAVTGMIMALGLIEGSGVSSREERSACYEKVQLLAKRFEEENGSVICASLLGLAKPEGAHIPEERTTSYYKKRPCPELCRCAANILEEYLKTRS